MPVLPVISRELRASARHRATFHVRTLGAAALFATSIVFGLNHGFGPHLGGRLFTDLHRILLLGIWILVPILGADSISRERREGTLGLLFLTLLKPRDVVIAKILANALKAISIWIAVLPILMIPLLLGGVSWSHALSSALITLSSICWALAAGLLGSAWSKSWLRSVVYAAFLVPLFFLFLSTILGELLLQAVGPTGLISRAFSEFPVLSGLALLTNLAGAWDYYLRITSTSQLLWILTEMMLFSFLGLALAIALAGAKIRRSWQEEPPSARQVWFEKQFCTPVLWVSFFRGWMRRKLERNPIGWLEQRTWTGRLVTWGWFAVVVSLYSAVFTDRNFFRGYDAIQRMIAWLLAGSLAMSAAGSFRRERESGVLELLLVSPLGENQIISGRLGGLYAQFLPSFGLLLGVWMYFSSVIMGRAAGAVAFYAATFFALPVIGLYFSLRCRSFLSAFLWTLMTGLLLPLLVPPLLSALWLVQVGLFHWHIRLSAREAFVQLLIAAFCWFRLHDRLKQRAFAFNRGD